MSPEHDDSTDETQRLSVHLVNGPTVACGGFKAIERGVLLFEDAERERVAGFVPYGELRFVLPTNGDTRPSATNAAESDGSQRGEMEAEAEGGDERGTEVEVRGAEEAAEAEAQEPDATTGTEDVGDGDGNGGEEEATTGTDSDGSRDLTAVTGIGEAHAEDLRNAGIGSLGALAAADASDVAEAADISLERAEQWTADAAEASEESAEEENSDGPGAES